MREICNRRLGFTCGDARRSISRWLAAGTQLGKVTVFDAQGHKKLSPPDDVGRVDALAVGPDKLAVLVPRQGNAQLWSIP